VRPEDLDYETGDVSKLTGMTGKMLRYWDDTGLFPASGRSGDGERGQGTRRLWSFRDVIVLRAITRLRAEGITTHRIRRALDYLRRSFPELDGDFAGVVFVVWGVDVVALPPGETMPISIVKAQGQRVLAVPVDSVRAEVAQIVRDLGWVA